MWQSLKMSPLCPPPPSGVPASLTQASASYRRLAYLAVLGLITFLTAYFALAGWFAYTAFRLFGVAGEVRRPLWVIVAAVASSLLALFMLKAVVFIRRGSTGQLEPIDPAAQPELMRFINQVADEAKAPRPRRVYLSHDVNAAVFYDLSLLNLILPSKKNLLIGLGLVNVLNLSELKAVLAHEFGHFAQRSMKIGRWVYITQQIAAHLVARRDALDRMLEWLSGVDIRIAWIGWVLRLIIWSIRSLVETVFGWVLLIERALTRQMELQADLVAVSLTGSDALIHGLAKLQAADEELDRAIRLMLAERDQRRPVADVYALQTWLIDKRREILADPRYGGVPPVPDDPEAAAKHRVFESWDHQPSRMWATHPANDLREANAKQTYVRCAVDERSAWLLFANPEGLRQAMTRSLYDQASVDQIAPEPVPPVPLEASLAALTKRFDTPRLDPRYRGLYLDRSPVRHTTRPAELVTSWQALADQSAAGDPLVHTLTNLYRPDLKDDLSLRQERFVEVATLEAIARGDLRAPGGIVRFRGAQHKRAELGDLVQRAKTDREAILGRLRQHDLEIRSAHLEAARRHDAAHPPASGECGQEGYLVGLLEVLHYAEHTQADLVDAAGVFESVLAIVVADGKVSEGELNRLLGEASQLYANLAPIYENAAQIHLDEALLSRIEATSWSEHIGGLDLAYPQRELMGEWLSVYRSWVVGTAGQLEQLSSVALAMLLETEARLADWTLGRLPEGSALPPRPARSSVLATYPTLLEGVERPRHYKLGLWDRFVLADGLLPMTLRLVVAGGIVATVLVAASALRGRGG